MQDWKIALMVIICVVFVILTVFLSVCIYLWWDNDPKRLQKRHRFLHCCSSRDLDEEEADRRRSSRRRRSSKNNEHRYGADADGNDDGDDDEGDSPTRAQHGGRRNCCCYPGCKPNKDILYFLDFSQTLRSVNIRSGRIRTGVELQVAVAREARVTDRIDTLSLAATYASSGAATTATANVGGAYLVGDNTMEVDLDRLVSSDGQRDQRMRQTAMRPLLLHRLTEVDLPGHNNIGDGGSPVASLANPFGSPVAATASGGGATAVVNSNMIDVSVSRQQSGRPAPLLQQQQPSIMPWNVMTTTGRGGGGDGGPSSPIAGIFSDPRSPAPLPPVTSVPAPLIFPTRTAHITTATPVFIMAADYYICLPNNSNASAFDSNHHHQQQQGAQKIQDEETRALLESAMCSEHTNNTTTTVRPSSGPHRGCTFTVDPQHGTALLRTPSNINANGGSVVELVVVRRRAAVVRYCLDTSGASQWRAFEAPIYLPAGRWCLQAKVSSADDRFTDTAAKVFSVSVA